MSATIPRVALDVDEAATSCSVKPETIKRAIRSGKLRAKRSGDNGGGKYLILIADLEAWVQGMSAA